MAYKTTKFDEASFDVSLFDSYGVSGGQKMFEGKYANSKLGRALAPKKSIFRALK